jgi:hypothetical protein
MQFSLFSSDLKSSVMNSITYPLTSSILTRILSLFSYSRHSPFLVQVQQRTGPGGSGAQEQRGCAGPAGVTRRKKDLGGLLCHGRRIDLSRWALHPQPRLSRQLRVFLRRHVAIPPLLHPDLHNTVSSRRIRLSGGARIKGKLFLL